MIFVWVIIGMWMLVITAECCERRSLLKEIKRLKNMNKSQQYLIVTLQADNMRMVDMIRKGKHG